MIMTETRTVYMWLTFLTPPASSASSPWNTTWQYTHREMVKQDFTQKNTIFAIKKLPVRKTISNIFVFWCLFIYLTKSMLKLHTHVSWKWINFILPTKEVNKAQQTILISQFPLITVSYKQETPYSIQPFTLRGFLRSVLSLLMSCCIVSRTMSLLDTSNIRNGLAGLTGRKKLTMFRRWASSYCV